MVALSVIVPTYNCERTLAEALESVLAQTPLYADVVVIDTGSTDDTVAVAESFGYLVRVIHAPNDSLASAFNRGVRETRGSVIGSIDPSDRWLPHKLQRQLAALEADESIGAVFGYMREFLSPEHTRMRWSFEKVAKPSPSLCRGAMLVRRTTWERVGEFETNLHTGEFATWYARAISAGVTMHVIPELVYERRVSGVNPAMLSGAAGS